MSNVGVAVVWYHGKGEGFKYLYYDINGVELLKVLSKRITQGY